ncbi:anti-sigma factor domain-containing protein [Cohnella panacarvi]|uniref:anti-sigma factor domain-containing protein n=1 Tax=Cohnella panacarvi TaxID=400776 RepID=UPI00047A86DB|nr:anti-sigma factor domain-containing protein [Cohnella panacarvi]
MNRGTIMALDHTTAVVLTPGGEFVKVRRLPGYEIGAEITYRVRRNAVKLRRWLQGGAGAAVLLALFFGFWLMQPPSVVAYVSMDVNPSVEIGLDEKMNVRKLRAVNPDAEAIVAEVKFKGEALEAVMQALAARLVEAKLLTPHSSDIVIASVPVKSIAAEWESQVTEKMRAVLNEATNPQNNDQAAVEIEVTTISVPPEIRKLANEQGVSSGKMAFWLAAESQGRDVSIDKLKEQSLKKIAEEWGGVDKVLGDDAKHKNDAKAWKERIGQAENKLSASKENKAADDRNSDKKKREDKKREDKKREDKKNEDKKSDDKNGDINKGRSKDNKGKDNDRKDKEDKKKEDERKEVHDKSDWNKGGNPKNGPKDDDRKSGSKDREEDKREVERKPNPDPDRRRP